MFWSSNGVAFGSQALKRYEYKPLMPPSLPPGKSLSVLGESEVNIQTYEDPKVRVKGKTTKRVLVPRGPVIPDAWTSPLRE